MSWTFQPTANASDAGGVWRTTADGSRIFIKDGEAYAGGPKGPKVDESASTPKKSSKEEYINPVVLKNARKNLQKLIDDNEFFGFEDFLDEDQSVKDMSREEMMGLVERMDSLVKERYEIAIKSRPQEVMKDVWPAIVKAQKEIQSWETAYRNKGK